jgi:LmbE family N-acetylglucosaminyl deacetylase
MRAFPAELAGARVVVVSPHLDDAALSLGATVARAARAGADVVVATVFAGDPSSDTPAGDWDGRCGFATLGDAASARRAEDERACAALGATPVWLSFSDEQYAPESDDTIWEALAPIVGDADVVLVPGSPLANADHMRLAALLVPRLRTPHLALYAEQPYAANVLIGRGHSWRPFAAAARIGLRSRLGRRPAARRVPEPVARLVPAELEWRPVPRTRRDVAAKVAAIRAYESQWAGLGMQLLTRIRLHELVEGGEYVALARMP